MKKLNLLLLVTLLFLFSGCSIFGNDDDDDDNPIVDKTTPFEGSWSFSEEKYVFSEDSYNYFNYADITKNEANKNFSYDEAKSTISLGAGTNNYLIKENQLLMGGGTGGYAIFCYQKCNTTSASTFKIVKSDNGSVVLNKASDAILRSFYLDKDLILDSLKNISVKNIDFISYKDTSRGVSVMISGLEKYKGLSFGTEIEMHSPLSSLFSEFFLVSLQGYNSDYEKVGNMIEWTVEKFKMKSYSYDPATKLDAVFYDLKDSDDNTILDTLKLNIDFSNIESFKKMLKNL